ncbi:hypothetical protein ACB092_12G116200 [Castanea dentata]
MKASIGTPPVDIYGIIDTASNIVWTQCVPCDVCFNVIHPSEISCHSKKCHEWYDVHCSPQNSCNYVSGYISGLSNGVMAKEKVTITSSSGQAVSFDIAFGCAHNITYSDSNHTTRIIALGAGPLSFPSQIGSKRFSYCLLPYAIEYTYPNITSKISFGNGSEVVGDDVVSTPMFVAEEQYNVTLEGISVGDTYVPFNSSGKVSKGSICGSEERISIEPMKNDTLLGYRLCYRTEITNDNGPILTVHFEGADVELKPIQTFNQPVRGYDIYYFAIINHAKTELASLGDQGLYGNYVQANFLIGFDLETRIVSFKSTDCTKL